MVCGIIVYVMLCMVKCQVSDCVGVWVCVCVWMCVVFINLKGTRELYFPIKTVPTYAYKSMFLRQ